jgi:HAD superfamily hydrolase (TIGR01458 family)
MARGILLDIDGVLTVSWRPLPGATETIRWLQEEGIPFRLVTNTSSRSRRQIAELLRDAGMDIDAAHVLTAVSSAGHYLNEHYRGVSCLVVNAGDLGEDLGHPTTEEPGDAGVVLLGGAGPSVGYQQLDAVFKLALGGTPVVALHRNTHFETDAGPALDMGAFVVGLEAASGIAIPTLGKPAPEFFRAALAELEVTAAHACMVGDDITSDVLGAQASGITGILVRTGKFRPADLERRSGEETPDHIVDGIGDIPALWPRLSPG